MDPIELDIDLEKSFKLDPWDFLEILSSSYTEVPDI